jgi:hypothetical protein
MLVGPPSAVLVGKGAKQGREEEECQLTVREKITEKLQVAIVRDVVPCVQRRGPENPRGPPAGNSSRETR